MMNLFQLQEQLKDLSKQQLVNEMQSPSGNAPPFLVMTELQRRTRMENAAALEKGSPTTTVAQDAVNASGVPQGGIADMARSLAPQSDVTQNTGALTPQAGAMPQTGAAPVQAMQEGGLAGISRDLKDYKKESTGIPVSGEIRDFGSELARMREVERAQEIAAKRGPPVSSLPTPIESLITSLTPDAIQNVPMVEVDRSYQPQTMGATKLDMAGIRQSLIGPPREAVQNVPSETPAVYYDPYFQPDPGAVEGETTAQKLSRLGGPFREGVGAVPALADKYVLGPALSIPQSVMAGGSAALGAGASVLGFPEIGQQYLDQAGNWQGDAVMLANEGYFGANAAQPQPQNLGDMTPGELLPPVLTDTTPALTDTAPALTDTAPTLTDTAPAVIQRAPGGGGASVGGISVPPPQSSEDRMLQQDKWLALARFGAALASSQAPTFGQALGQATTVGLDALGKARQDFLERKALADQMALKRGALAARGGGGAKAPKPGLSANIVRALTALEPDIASAEDKLAQLKFDIDNSSTWGRSPPEDLVTKYNLQQERLGELVGRRSAITRMGVGLNPMGTPDVAGSGEIAHNVAD